MEIIRVTEKETVNMLYNGSAFTMEGFFADEENLTNLSDWIRRYTEIKNERYYIISGMMMNQFYHLTGSNRYPDDFTIVCMRLEDMKSPTAIVIPRLQIQGRWFDDIVDNNARREEEYKEITQD